MTLAAQMTAGSLLPTPALQAEADPIVVAIESFDDKGGREALLDRAFGPERFRKTCERLRAGRLPALALVARVRKGPNAGEIVGTVRLWHVDAGGTSALMLGPLAVDARWRCYGIGARLMLEALDRARALGHRAVLLVGDAPYYARFGFERRFTLNLRLPGPVEPERFLGLELQRGAFEAASGLVKATGAPDPAANRRRAYRVELQTAA